MNEYDGEWTGYFSGMKLGGCYEFTTSNHYPGDPNFSGSFSDWIWCNNTLTDKCKKAFEEYLTVVIKIESGRIVSIKQVVEL